MTAQTHPRHHVSRAVAQLEATLDEVADASLWSMDTAETAEVLVRLTRAGARLAELEARLASHAGTVGVPEQVGATSVAIWWAHETRMTRGEAHRKTKLAAGLTDRHTPVRDALAAGDLLVDQARVIIRAVEDLPDQLDPDLAMEAERHLVGQAAHFDAIGLRHLGKGLLHVIDPDAADAHTAQLLDREERTAAQTTRLTLREDDGVLRGTFTLPLAQGQMLKKQLLAIAAPKHQAATDGGLGERRPGPERLGRAFCEWIERYPTNRLPSAGGVSATVVVTIPLETLTGGLKPGVLDTGTTISPGQARRLACEAGIIPLVLGGTSEPLDVGRRRRFHSKAQRIAIAHRDGGCTADGCDWPPGMCHTHHDPTWATGGHTNTKHGRLLCPQHHARAHDPAYTTTKLPGGKVAFTRRT